MHLQGSRFRASILGLGLMDSTPLAGCCSCGVNPSPVHALTEEHKWCPAIFVLITVNSCLSLSRDHSCRMQSGKLAEQL